MNKIKILSVCIIVVVNMFTFTYYVFGETIDELYQQKDDLTNKIEDSNNQLLNVQDDITWVNVQIKKLNEQIAKYQLELNESNIKVAQAQKRVDDIKKELETAEKQFEYYKKLLEQRLVSIYEGGDTFYLDVLLSSKSIEDFLSRFYYLSKIAQYDRMLVSEVSNIKEQLSNQKVLLEKELEKLKIEKENNEALLVTFENTKIVRNSYLDQLTEEEQKLQQDIETYEEDIENLEKKILEVALLNIGEDYIGGELAWPVPNYRTVTSGFGMRIHPITKVYSLHTGVDIGAPEGKPIIAANDGIVVLTDYSTSYGYYVMIDHGGGVVTLYAHGSKICAEEGQQIKKGDLIMLVGTTGWSTGPHLHFEIRINGEVVDPLPYITSNKMPSTTDTDEEENNEIIENNIDNLNNLNIIN